MELYGKKATTNALRKRVGNMDQIAGIRLVQFDDGNERPVRAALFHTGSGLEFTVMLDRCLDIAAASFQGKAMGWRSSTGDVAPQYFETEGLRPLRSFTGGLVTTCGLINVGSPAEGSELNGNGLHGRIGNIPARNIKVTQEWQGNDYVLSVSGSMRETRLFGENLVLTRTVSTKLGSRSFSIEDVLTNDSFAPQPFQLLYHCNIGWPALDEGSEMASPSASIAPRDGEAVNGQENWWKCDAPTSNYAEKVYYHDMQAAKDGSVTCAILNNGFEEGNGFGVYVKFNKNELPRFTHWKQMGEQAYVTGFEPCTCGVQGWAVDKQHGLLHSLKPGESRTFHLEFGPVTGADEAAALKAARDKAKTKMVSSYLDFVQKPK